MPVETPAQLGEAAVDAAARKYGLVVRDDRRGFWDAKYKSNGRKVQIKSARYRRGDGPGVIRVWREHLRELAQVGGSVVVVVVNPENPQQQVLRVTRESPRRLLRLADFRDSGQSEMLGKSEGRIPWPEVVTLR